MSIINDLLFICFFFLFVFFNSVNVFVLPLSILSLFKSSSFCLFHCNTPQLLNFYYNFHAMFLCILYILPYYPTSFFKLKSTLYFFTSLHELLKSIIVLNPLNYHSTYFYSMNPLLYSQ